MKRPSEYVAVLPFAPLDHGPGTPGYCAAVFNQDWFSVFGNESGSRPPGS
jgi:hypothetical protein